MPSKGTTLVETMIAVAILAVGLLGLMAMMTNTNSVMSSNQSQIGNQSLKQALITGTAGSSSCSNILASGQTFSSAAAAPGATPASPPQYVNLTIDGVPIASGTPQYLKDYNVTVTGLTFQLANTINGSMNAISPDPCLGAGFTAYVGNLFLSSYKGQLANQALMTQSVGGLVLSVRDADNVIMSCSGGQGATDACQNCLLMGGIYNPSPTPPATSCQINYPCTPPNIYLMGYSSSGSSICFNSSELTPCPPGDPLVSQGSSISSCSLPSPTPVTGVTPANCVATNYTTGLPPSGQTICSGNLFFVTSDPGGPMSNGQTVCPDMSLVSKDAAIYCSLGAGLPSGVTYTGGNNVPCSYNVVCQ